MERGGKTQKQMMVRISEQNGRDGSSGQILYPEVQDEIVQMPAAAATENKSPLVLNPKLQNIVKSLCYFGDLKFSFKHLCIIIFLQDMAKIWPVYLQYTEKSWSQLLRDQMEAAIKKVGLL
jgi:hypothetical protein